MPKRSSLLTIVLLSAIAAVGMRIYLFWQEGIGSLPAVVMQHAPVAVAEAKQQVAVQPLAPIEIIISKNLFDPERGAIKPKEAEADVRSLQRIRSLVLLGTAIVDSNRFAFIQEGSNSGGTPTSGRSAGPLRYKIGDVIEGFSLSDIRDKIVVFRKGASRVELALDFFRKIEPSALARSAVSQPSVAANSPASGQTGAVAPARPRVVPQLPRRDRLPAPPS